MEDAMKMQKPSSPAERNPSKQNTQGSLPFQDFKKEIDKQLNDIDAGLRRLQREMREQKARRNRSAVKAVKNKKGKP